MTSYPAKQTLSLDEWLSVLKSDYLESFIRNGGAAVKVAACPDMARSHLTTALLSAAAEFGFLTARVDAGTSKIHLIDKLFNDIARQIDWHALAGEFLTAELLGIGYSLPENGVSVEALAAANSTDINLVRQETRKILTREVYRDRALNKEFRLGMGQLCRSLLEPDDPNAGAAENICRWLTGDLQRITALKPQFIYSRVNRHTARGILSSSTAWIRKSRRPGLFVAIDMSRYAVARPPDDGGLRYSKLAALDQYEVLRQFIDSTDEMAGCLMVFLAGPEFVEDEQRGYRAYEALRLRLTDDVFDRRRPNPLAPMVRIEG